MIPCESFFWLLRRIRRPFHEILVKVAGGECAAPTDYRQLGISVFA
jgi:hypothetical protein